MKTAWDVLGISPSASSLEVRRAFAAGVRAAHPDTGADPALAPDRLAELLEARDIAVKLNGYREAARDPVARPATEALGSKVTAAEPPLRAAAHMAAETVTRPRPAHRPARPSMAEHLARAARRSLRRRLAPR